MPGNRAPEAERALSFRYRTTTVEVDNRRAFTHAGNRRVQPLAVRVINQCAHHTLCLFQALSVGDALGDDVAIERVSILRNFQRSSFLICVDSGHDYYTIVY